MQLGDQAEPLRRVVVVLGVVESRRVGLLAAVHRDVGAADQGLGVGAVLGEEGDADAGVDLQLDLVDLLWLGEHRAHPLGQRQHRRGVGDIEGEDAELVSAEPGDGVALAHLRRQAGGERPQQPVAAVMAERVVDFLEAVEVDHDHRETGVPRPRVAHRRFGAVVEGGAVGKVGEAVVVGLVLDLLHLSSQRAGDPPQDREEGEVEPEQDEEDAGSEGEEDAARVAGDRRVVPVQLENPDDAAANPHRRVALQHGRVGPPAALGVERGDVADRVATERFRKLIAGRLVVADQLMV